eukprot:TRINITY_DN6602_c1_g1_i4.p1 TRINITY_DN6602_c1_g1~~TRINITY_DN6602_c1_g1_i4.p1  ORF type:complete len:376 (-),score=70.87 TRINITY_DN6602_c1_g1_i4:196-1323(-)
MRRVLSLQRRFGTAFLSSTGSVLEQQQYISVPQILTPGLIQNPGYQQFRSFGSIVYPSSQVFVGKQAPAFSAPAVVDGEISSISLDQYKGKYVVLFFYPKDFTFVCPTEIIAFSDRAKEFEALNCQLIAASTDTEESHLAWIKTPRKRGGLGFMQIPILADTTKDIAAKYGVLIDEGPAEGIALRGLFIINPEGVVEQITVNSLPVGRSVDEALRLLQAIQFVKEHGEVCPADWKPGQDTMIADPEKSMDYFSKQSEVPTGDDDFGLKLKSIKSGKEYSDIVKSGKKIVVEFMAPWCGKCRMLSPHLEALQDKHSSVEFYKLDTTDEQLEGLSAELAVKALPVVKFFKDGKEVMDNIIGYKKQPIIDAVEKLAGM